MKQKALADSVIRLRALEKGKEMDIQRFADITKRYEALEKGAVDLKAKVEMRMRRF